MQKLIFCKRYKMRTTEAALLYLLPHTVSVKNTGGENKALATSSPSSIDKLRKKIEMNCCSSLPYEHNTANRYNTARAGRVMTKDNDNNYVSMITIPSRRSLFESPDFH